MIGDIADGITYPRSFADAVGCNFKHPFKDGNCFYTASFMRRTVKAGLFLEVNIVDFGIADIVRSA